jgi:hypothetical protein
VLVPQTLAISSTKTVPPLAMRMHPHTTWNGSGQAVVTRVAPVDAKRTAQPVRAASSGATVRRKDGERGRNRTYNLLIKSMFICHTHDVVVFCTNVFSSSSTLSDSYAVFWPQSPLIKHNQSQYVDTHT